nr:hypothetical protein [Pantoea agglomerans]
MTNEEKQELIENIKSVIDEYDQFGGGGMDEQVYRIALASMMANPVAYTDVEQLTELSKSTFAEIYSPDDSFKSDPEWVPLFTRPAPAVSLAELVPGDYFGELVLKARASANKAMLKFPQPNYVLLKVAEEAGEVVQAGVHYAENRMTWQEVEGEIVQLLAMLIRLVTEGDQVNGITPPESCRSAILRNIEEAK